MNLAEIRQKYPQYDDLSDLELVQGLHQKFYSEYDFNDFAEAIGYQENKGFIDKALEFPEQAYKGVLTGAQSSKAGIGGMLQAEGALMQQPPERRPTTAEYALAMESGAIPEEPISAITGKPLSISRQQPPEPAEGVSVTNIPDISFAGIFEPHVERTDLSPQQKFYQEKVRAPIGAAIEEKGYEITSAAEKTLRDHPEWAAPLEIEKGAVEAIKANGLFSREAALAITRGVSESAPQFGASTALAIGGAMTGNPVLAGIGISSGLGSTYMIEGGNTYNELLAAKVPERDAAKIAKLVGSTNTIIEAGGLGYLFSRIPALKGAFSRQIAKEAVQSGWARRVAGSAAAGGISEGAEEATQQVVSNAAKRLYDENQSLFEGVEEGAFIGFIMGGLGGGVAGIKKPPSRESIAKGAKDGTLTTEQLTRLKADKEAAAEVGLTDDEINSLIIEHPKNQDIDSVLERAYAELDTRMRQDALVEEYKTQAPTGTLPFQEELARSGREFRLAQEQSSVAQYQPEAPPRNLNREMQADLDTYQPELPQPTEQQTDKGVEYGETPRVRGGFDPNLSLEAQLDRLEQQDIINTAPAKPILRKAGTATRQDLIDAGLSLKEIRRQKTEPAPQQQEPVVVKYTGPTFKTEKAADKYYEKQIAAGKFNRRENEVVQSPEGYRITQATEEQKAQLEADRIERERQRQEMARREQERKAEAVKKRLAIPEDVEEESPPQIPPKAEKQLRKEAMQEADADPNYAMIRDAQNRGIKLFDLHKDYDADTVKQIQKKFPAIFVGAGRVAPDAFASEYGMTTDEMIQRFLDTPPKKAVADKLYRQKANQWQENESKMQEELGKPERLAGVAGVPGSVVSVSGREFTEEQKIKQIVADAVGQPLMVAKALDNKGKNGKAEEVRSKALKKAQALRLADGPTTERLINEEIEKHTDQAPVRPETDGDAVGAASLKTPQAEPVPPRPAQPPTPAPPAGVGELDQPPITAPPTTPETDRTPDSAGGLATPGAGPIQGSKVDALRAKEEEILSRQPKPLSKSRSGNLDAITQYEEKYRAWRREYGNAVKATEAAIAETDMAPSKKALPAYLPAKSNGETRPQTPKEEQRNEEERQAERQREGRRDELLTEKPGPVSKQGRELVNLDEILPDLEITIPTKIADTGEVRQVKYNAREELAGARAEVTRWQKLVDCLKS